MAVARTVFRLVAGAEVALAVFVLAACAGSTSAPRSAGVQQSAAAGSGSTPGTAVTPAGQPNPTSARTSLFNAFAVAGLGSHIVLTGVPDGANCSVTAHAKGHSEQLAITQEYPQFTLDNPPGGATIEWSATCNLDGESKTSTFETTIESSETTTPTPTSAPTHTGTPTTEAPTPSAGHSQG